jgi:hypothetical protein
MNSSSSKNPNFNIFDCGGHNIDHVHQLLNKTHGFVLIISSSPLLELLIVVSVLA